MIKGFTNRRLYFLENIGLSPGNIMHKLKSILAFLIVTTIISAMFTFKTRNALADVSDVYIYDSNNGKPVVKQIYPEGSGFNEKDLDPVIIDGTSRYFLRVTFEDADGTLMFDETKGLELLKTSSVFIASQNEVSQLDSQFLDLLQNLGSDLKQVYISNYVFVKNPERQEDYLYIPVKPLKSQTTYTVMINANIVYYPGSGAQNLGNDMITWSFTTSAVPVVTGIDMGSVPERYDEDIPIIIKGDYFDGDNVEVYFNDIRADRVRHDTDADGKPILLVYLPSGRNRLEPGIYSVKVQNDTDHEYIVYGAFSVVTEGQNVPNEEYRVKTEKSVGEVRASLDRSEDTLILDRDYTDRSHVLLDLDDLMGEDVLVRKISFRGSPNDVIGELETLSKWANISLYNVTLGNWYNIAAVPGINSSGAGVVGSAPGIPAYYTGSDTSYKSRDIEIRLGRVEPAVSQKLKADLGPGKVKSELIQVTGQNYMASGVKLIIPFDKSSGENLKALRYDETLKTWQEEYFTVDKVNKTVTITSASPGIFAVMEGGE